MTNRSDDNWQRDVRTLLRTGLGVEDIALRLRCPVAAVRAEVAILRQERRAGTHVRGRSMNSATITLPWPPAILSPNARVHWSDNDDKRLIALHGTMTIREIADALGRSSASIRGRVTRLGLAKRQLWSAEEEAQIIEAYRKAGESGFLDLDKIAKSLGRMKSNVCRKAKMLSLPTNPNRVKVAEKKDRRRFKGDAEALNEWRRMPKWTERPHPRGMAGKKHSDETKRTIGLRSRDWWLFTPVEKREEITAKMLRTKAAKGIGPAKVKRGSWDAGWREIGGKRNFYRSRWEANYARYLQWLKENGDIVDWQHEPETFWFDAIKRGVRSYKPDFRVTENNGKSVLHEVKGWMDSRSRTTLRRMKKYHPQEKIVLIDGKQYRAIRSKVMAMIPEWEDSARDSHA